MPDVLFFLLLGHFFGDYALQTDHMAQHKGTSVGILSLHVLIYTLCVGIFWGVGKRLTGDAQFPTLVQGVVLVALYLQHWIQDRVKTVRSNGGKQSLFLDQAIHLAILFVIRIFF